jgi:hypothetical protein
MKGLERACAFRIFLYEKARFRTGGLGTRNTREAPCRKVEFQFRNISIVNKKKKKKKKNKKKKPVISERLARSLRFLRVIACANCPRQLRGRRG